MTPNPNPSPELREALQRVERFMSQLIPNLPLHVRRNNTEAIVQAANDFADLRAALSPQTLLAPGEVDFRALLIEAGRNAGALLDDRVSDDFLKGIPEEVRLKIERLREDTRTIQRNTATYRQEARTEADAANERAAEANKRADNMAEANRRLLAAFEADPTALATVAAANDEGVAGSIETVAHRIYDACRPDHPLPYDVCEKLATVSVRALATSRSHHEGASL